MPEWITAEIAMFAVVVPICIFIYKLSAKMDGAETRATDRESRAAERHAALMDLAKETLEATYSARKEATEDHGTFLERLAVIEDRTRK